MTSSSSLSLCHAVAAAADVPAALPGVALFSSRRALADLAAFAAAVVYTLTPGVVFKGDEKSSGRRRGGSSSSGESRKAASLTAGERQFCLFRRAVAGVVMFGKLLKPLAVSLVP